MWGPLRGYTGRIRVLLLIELRETVGLVDGLVASEDMADRLYLLSTEYLYGDASLENPFVCLYMDLADAYLEVLQ